MTETRFAVRVPHPMRNETRQGRLVRKEKNRITWNYIAKKQNDKSLKEGENSRKE